MSIVNQMLKDLDARCGPASSNQLAALQSLGLIATTRSPAPNLRIFLTWCCVSLFTVIALYQAFNWWHSAQVPADTAPTTAQVAVSVPSASMAMEAPPLVETDRIAPTGTQPEQGDVAQNKTAIETTELLAKIPALQADPVTVTEQQAAEPVKKLSPQQKADRFFADAQLALDRQDYTQGETLLRQALFELPQHHTARAQLATLLITRQDNDAAERLLSQGIRLNPQEPLLVRPYAQLLVARGELESALSVLSTILTSERAAAETYAMRAAVLHRLGRNLAAAADYRRALKQQPQNAVWWVGLAIAEEHEEFFQSALSAYRRAAQLPMENALSNFVAQRMKLIQVMDGQ